ncbi:MAG: amidophosphoribosyltransferase [Ignavibacteria bacterium]|nr:amidophosphoribosyltransferase [Bacteroidota bacterium]MSQ45457.1 amidophosphoribosyltransferase [Ignavibacteria bacterium]
MPKKINLPNDKPKCACGIFGAFGSKDSSLLTYYGLHALQHRGQEASGIVSSHFDNKKKKQTFNIFKGMGLVTDVFKDQTILSDLLIGNSSIGHNRYSTAGSSKSRQNIQPFIVNYAFGNLAIAHNGNLTNFHKLRTELQNAGTLFQTTSDSEIFLHLIARSKKKNQLDQILEALNKVEGAFSLLILTDTSLIIARDAFGFRPLSLGKKGKSFVVSSETCAFDMINAEFIREVKPGEVIVIDKNSLKSGKIKSYKLDKKVDETRHCIFEYIYFSRPDSFIFGETVDNVRRKLGKALAQESPVKTKDDLETIVISVPDSSNTATIGYASESEKQGINSKYEIGLIRNHYVGRTFIQPLQEDREMKVKTKFNTVKNVLKGKRVIVVDDSIVRGTTSKQLVKLIKEASPAEIHMRITSPPIVQPCHYGMDFPSKKELIAVQCDNNVKKIEKELGVDSLHYLSIEKLLDSVPKSKKKNYCYACFGGKYPTPIEQGKTKEELDK